MKKHSHRRTAGQRHVALEQSGTPVIHQVPRERLAFQLSNALHRRIVGQYHSLAHVARSCRSVVNSESQLHIVEIENQQHL